MAEQSNIGVAIDTMRAMRKCYHARCVVCASPHNKALGLDFEVKLDGSVQGECVPSASFEGYNGLLHGGGITSLLDGAMTNCLFAHGIVAVTAELNVRFRHPVELLEPLEVTANISRRTPPLFHLEARLTQGGILKAKAAAKFMEIPDTLVQEIEHNAQQNKAK